MDVADTERLENCTEIAIGMEVMITQNIATDASLTNGSRGIISDIILDSRQEMYYMKKESGIVRLDYPPVMVVFEPYRKPTTDPLPGLPPSQVPVFPCERSFNVGGKMNRIKVTRRQVPLTQGYTFTDHKAQGQTLENVLVDIGKLSRFSVNPFAAYVALSRSRGRHKIRLLREFEEKLFITHPSVDLREEDKWLHIAANETKKKWRVGAYKYI
jgi:ATP-dependent exoDNAse (exonuclease V) alpha subunit